MSMQDRLPNGASVSRLFSDNKTELLAIFQYQTDAEAFAKSRLADDTAREWKGSTYIVACTYSGRIQAFGPSGAAMSSTDKD